MSSPIKVGSGYIEVTPRLSKNAVSRLQASLNRQMGLVGGNAGRSMGASISTAVTNRIKKDMPSLSGIFTKEAKKAGTSYGSSFADAVRQATRGKISFADAGSLKALRNAAASSGTAVGKSFAEGIDKEFKNSVAGTIRTVIGLGNTTNREIRQISESVRQWSNRMQGFGQDWSLFITAPIVASMATVTAWGLQVGAELQKAQIGIQRLAEVSGLSTAAAANLAREQLADLRRFAEDTTFEFAPLANGVQRLMAAGLEAQTATHWIKTLGDTTAAYGAGADEMNRAIIAISQSMAAGKIYAQDMNQLNNAGIPIWRMMAEATGQTEAELRELGKAGELLSDDVWPQLIEYMETYEGTARRMASDIPLYAWGNALEAFRNALGDLINGTDETMRVVDENRPRMWISLFETLEETITRMTPIVGQVLDYIIPVITRGLEGFNNFLENITNAEGEVNNFGLALMGIAALMGPAMMIVGFIGRGIASIISGLRLLPDGIANLSDVADKLDQLADSALNTGDAVSESGDKTLTFGERIRAVGEHLADSAKSGWAQGTEFADRFGAGVVRAADKIGEFGDKLRTLPGIVGGALLKAEDRIGLFAVNSMINIEKFADTVVKLPGRINDGFTKVMDRFNDLRVDVRDFTGFVKMQMPQSWGEAADLAKAAIDGLGEFAERRFDQIREAGKNIVVNIRERYHEAGGVRGIARRGVEAAGRGAAAVGRGAVAAGRATFGAIGSLISILSSLLGPALEVIQKVLGGAMDMLGSTLATLAEAFSSALLPALTAAILALTPAILAFTPIMEQLGEVLGPVLENLAGEFAKVIEQMAPIFGELISNLSPFLSEISTFVVELLGMLGPVVGELLIALSPVVALIAGAFIEALNFLLPILTKILEAISPLIPQIGEFLVGAIELITPMIMQLFEALEPLVPVLGDLLMSALETIVPIIFSLFEALQPIIPVLVTLLEAIMPIIEALLPLIELIGLLLGLVVSIVAPIIELAATILAWLIEKALVPLVEWLGVAVEWVADKLAPKIEWLSEKLVDFTETVADKFGEFKEKWDEIWNGLGAKAQEIYDEWIKPVVDGVGEAWDKVTGLFSGDPDEPEKKAKGGVIPGYAPGIDSVPALLSPGEGILRPEVVRWLGKSTIDAWNAGAMRGAIPRFATGGVVGASKVASKAAGVVLSGPVLAAPVADVGDELDALVDEYTGATGEIGTDWTRSADQMLKATESTMDKVTGKARDSLSTYSEGIIRPAMNKSAGHTKSGMKEIESTTSKGFSTVNNTTSSRMNSFVSTIQKATRDAANHWSTMISSMNKSTKGLVNTSYSKGIVGVLAQMSTLAGVGNPLKPVYLSTGGILPGYAPGIDTIPAMLSPGEAVLRPEVTRMLGPDLINAWNKAAMNGEIQHFATGGIVDGRAWVRKHQDDPYKGYVDAFKAAVKDVIDPSLRAFASLSGGYGSRGADDIRSGFPGISKWLGEVDKAADSGGSASKVIEILRREHDRGISGRPNKYTNGAFEAWCADFVSWVVDKARANKAYWNSPKGTPVNRWPAVRTWENAASRAGDYRFGTTGIKPGDIVTYGGGGQHINIVEKVLGGGRFQTIGGNESDRIRRQVRTTARGYGRPRWGLTGSLMGSGPFKGLTVKGWPGSYIDEPATDDGGIDRFLAQGAIVRAPTRAVIGEAGPEAVLPLTDRARTAELLEEIGLPHKQYNITINAAPNVPTEETLMKQLSYVDTIYG